MTCATFHMAHSRTSATTPLWLKESLNPLMSFCSSRLKDIFNSTVKKQKVRKLIAVISFFTLKQVLTFFKTWKNYQKRFFCITTSTSKRFVKKNGLKNNSGNCFFSTTFKFLKKTVLTILLKCWVFFPPPWNSLLLNGFHNLALRKLRRVCDENFEHFCRRKSYVWKNLLKFTPLAKKPQRKK